MENENIPANEEKEEFVDVETVMLTTEDGEEEYAILDYFNYQGHKYAICSPVEGDEIGSEVEIFRYKQNGDRVSMDIVSDKKTFNKIAEAYNKQA